MAHIDEIVRHGRVTSNWGKPYVPAATPAPCLLTQFEEQVKKLALAPGEYHASLELRSWCQRYASSRYVPEDLLKLWGIRLNDNWGNAQSY
jgi:hypothetical protein